MTFLTLMTPNDALTHKIPRFSRQLVSSRFQRPPASANRGSQIHFARDTWGSVQRSHTKFRTILRPIDQSARPPRAPKPHETIGGRLSMKIVRFLTPRPLRSKNDFCQAGCSESYWQKEYERKPGLAQRLRLSRFGHEAIEIPQWSSRSGRPSFDLGPFQSALDVDASASKSCEFSVPKNCGVFWIICKS